MSLLGRPPERDDAAPATSRPASGLLARADGGTAKVLWQIAEEVPVALMFNSEPFAVMMATPADLEDFAIGFALAERIVPDAGAIAGIIAMPVDNGFCIDIALREGVQPRAARRAIEGRSGCGLCGVEDIAEVVKPVRRVTRGFDLTEAAVHRAFEALPAHQPMNRLNHSVHAAAWCASGGHVLLAREDVGRHNALDKLIGALARQKIDPASGFVAMTSRCSFELVQKAAAAGIAYLATISAPTTLALRLAGEANIGLAVASREGIVFFG
ncbi:MAG: formate dehydrogenase accessory sulfurtransferase FdhD [Rhizobiales bacterium]|nr:formate dehydrogenase accessory sulfurtransferase FdhD [Hyphomicrobiales bacterium]